MRFGGHCFIFRSLIHCFCRLPTFVLSMKMMCTQVTRTGLWCWCYSWLFLICVRYDGILSMETIVFIRSIKTISIDSWRMCPCRMYIVWNDENKSKSQIVNGNIISSCLFFVVHFYLFPFFIRSLWFVCLFMWCAHAAARLSRIVLANNDFYEFFSHDLRE